MLRRAAQTRKRAVRHRARVSESMTNRLPYPPPYQDIRTVAAHISLSEDTIERLVTQGKFPAPRRVIDGNRIWSWNDISTHIKVMEEKKSNGVYFLRAGNFIKIGFSTRVQERISMMQTGCPYELILLGTMQGSLKDEKNLHKKFSLFRARAEWFRAEAELLEYIESVTEK